MKKLTEDQEKVMLQLDDASADPAPVNMAVVSELVDLGLLSKSGKNHLQFTAAGEAALKRLHQTKS